MSDVDPIPGPEGGATIPAGARRAMATEPIDLDAMKSDIASARDGTCDDDAAWRCVDHADRLAAELARLSRSEAEIRAKVAGEIEGAAASLDARAASLRSEDRHVLADHRGSQAEFLRSVAASIARESKGGEHA